MPEPTQSQIRPLDLFFVLPPPPPGSFSAAGPERALPLITEFARDVAVSRSQGLRNENRPRPDLGGPDSVGNQIFRRLQSHDVTTASGRDALQRDLAVIDEFLHSSGSRGAQSELFRHLGITRQLGDTTRELNAQIAGGLSVAFDAFAARCMDGGRTSLGILVALRPGGNELTRSFTGANTQVGLAAQFAHAGSAMNMMYLRFSER